MTDDVRSYGKVDLNALDEDYETDSVKFDDNRDKEIGKMLFRNVKLGQEYEDLDTKTAYETNGTTLSSDNAGKIVDVLVTGDGTHRPFESRAALLGWEPGGKVFFDGYGLYLDTDEHYPNTDAAREELIGKTANLMTATAFPQRTIQAVVVAQTIKDVGRDGSSGSPLPMFRLKEDGKTMVEKDDTKLNRFDYVKDGDEFIYFDEITRRSQTPGDIPLGFLHRPTPDSADRISRLIPSGGAASKEGMDQTRAAFGKFRSRSAFFSSGGGGGQEKRTRI